MPLWPSTKAKRVLAVLKRIGLSVKRQAGESHKVLPRPERPDYVWAFQDSVELGLKVLSRIARATGYDGASMHASL